MIDFDGFSKMTLITGKGWGGNMLAAQQSAQQFASSIEYAATQFKEVLNAMKTEKEIEFESEMCDVYMDLPGADVSLPCPACDMRTDLAGVIISLNDDHKWSREEIADWVDTLHDEGYVDLSFKERNV